MAKHPPKTKRELRIFGLALGGGLTVLGSLLWWKGFAVGPWLYAVAGTLALCGLAAPRLLTPLEKVFAAFARVVTSVLTYAILTLLFFLVVTPIGLLVRLFGKASLGRKPDRGKQSYWVDVEADGPWSRPEKPY